MCDWQISMQKDVQHRSSLGERKLKPRRNATLAHAHGWSFLNAQHRIPASTWAGRDTPRCPRPARSCGRFGKPCHLGGARRGDCSDGAVLLTRGPSTGHEKTSGKPSCKRVLRNPPHPPSVLRTCRGHGNRGKTEEPSRTRDPRTHAELRAGFRDAGGDLKPWKPARSAG